MMKSAYTGQLNQSWRRRCSIRDFPLNRCFFVKSQMSSIIIVILKIGPKYSMQVTLPNNNWMIGTFASNASVNSFDVRILPWTVEGCNHFLYPHRLHAMLKTFVIDNIPVSEKISERRVPWKGFNNLLRSPFSSGIRISGSSNGLPRLPCSD